MTNAEFNGTSRILKGPFKQLKIILFSNVVLILLAIANKVNLLS